MQLFNINSWGLSKDAKYSRCKRYLELIMPV